MHPMLTTFQFQVQQENLDEESLMKLSHKSIILWNFYGWVQFNTGSMSWGLVVSPARSRTQGPEFVSPPCRIQRMSLNKII